MTDGTAPAMLRAYVDRIERLDEEGRAISDDKRDVYAEAKGNGFDVKALKEVIGIRRRRERDGADAIAEHDAVVSTYLAALESTTVVAGATSAEKKPAGVKSSTSDEKRASASPSANKAASPENDPYARARAGGDDGADDVLDIPAFLDRRHEASGEARDAAPARDAA